MKYRPLMILGTGSDVGKSILTAAFCRIFQQDGIRVAPFKAQNMALNSFITSEGGEMGRAQVVQAQAAGISPHVDMNPILLKPSSEIGSQVIVHGKVYGNFPAREYYQQKPALVRKVMQSWRRLSESYDLIVLEGAGSAAELNLKKNDLVNFNMAKRADAAVILVADIDRGGVFAACIGTHYLLTRKEKELLQGFIINKFRGDPGLFEQGAEIIENKTKKPVFGVVPFMRDMKIPQEDSVALDRKLLEKDWEEGNKIKIGVIRLPHLSNYTDFDPLEQEPSVSLRYLDHRERINDVDLLILPGSKNTIADLKYLKESGMFTAILRYASNNGRLIGICGGFQLLGNTILDPLGVDGPAPRETALGLLPLVTSMAAEKTTTQVSAKTLGVGGSYETVNGYEIHMGQTDIDGPGEPAFEISERNGKTVKIADGWVSPDSRIWGTYIHGVFDNDGFRRKLLDPFLTGKDISTVGVESFDGFIESQYDKLADVVRKNLDIDRIYEIIRAY